MRVALADVVQGGNGNAQAPGIDGAKAWFQPIAFNRPFSQTGMVDLRAIFQPVTKTSNE
ncbi:MAG: hypothetical protein KGN32_10010 [Burkholderiales bacterium]|nr:hypothetical protein [Burkholderiales bacterium]